MPEIELIERPPGDLRWHVLWTRSNYEQRVHDQLAAKGFRLFLPRIRAWSRRGGLRHLEHLPMFPGYVFLHRDMDKAAYLEVSRTTGLVRLLGERWDQLAVVPAEEIAAIQRMLSAGMPILPHRYLQDGQRVRIVAGPLADVEGILLRSRPDKGLLVVSITMLRRSVAVEVDCTLVAAA